MSRHMQGLYSKRPASYKESHIHSRHPLSWSEPHKVEASITEKAASIATQHCHNAHHPQKAAQSADLAQTPNLANTSKHTSSSVVTSTRHVKARVHMWCCYRKTRPSTPYSFRAIGLIPASEKRVRRHPDQPHDSEAAVCRQSMARFQPKAVHTILF